MTETEAIAKLVPPRQFRSTSYCGGVMQIHVTRACNLACAHCTQGSQLGGKPTFMTPEQFETALKSLDGYFGVYGLFGGNPAMSPHFEAYCDIIPKYVPFERRGLWCNHPRGKGVKMAETFNPKVSNLNVHMDRDAYDEFKRDWPQAHVFGLDGDSRHSPVHFAMKDVIDDESIRWELISDCEINHDWSAMIGVFRGELRAWFCEVAGSQSMLMQHDPSYPDTGVQVVPEWWTAPMKAFAHQARKHCHECGVPLRGKGLLSQDAAGTETTTKTYQDVYQLKRKGRSVQVVDDLQIIDPQSLGKVTRYLQNGAIA